MATETEKLSKLENEILGLKRVMEELQTGGLQLECYEYPSDRCSDPFCSFETHQYVEGAIRLLEKEIREKALNSLREHLKARVKDAQLMLEAVTESIASL